jgi:hypothetical protein
MPSACGQPTPWLVFDFGTIRQILFVFAEMVPWVEQSPCANNKWQFLRVFLAIRAEKAA